MPVCDKLQYYDTAQKSCVNKLINGKVCLDTSNCRSDLGLSCQSKICLCDTSKQFWNRTACMNFFTYNSETCTDTSECLSPMVCKLSGTSCSCPATVSNSKCDCSLRAVRKEYYNSGKTCIMASVYGQSCSQNYTCQYLTEKTYCNGTCRCKSKEYFNTAKNICETLVSINGSCTQLNACDTTLNCISGVCLCPPGGRWLILTNDLIYN